MLRPIQSFSVALVALAGTAGCGFFDKTEEEKTTEEKSENSAPNEAGDGEGEKPSDKGSEGRAAQKNASGNVVDETTVTKDCPKSLSGSESISRLITKECGVVPVTGDYRIDGGTLTLEAGATLAFSDDAALYVGYGKSAKLVVKGTKEVPVTFTASGDKTPGAWKGVHLYKKAKRSVIEGLTLEYAGGKNGALLVDAEDVEIRNSTFQHLKEVGILVGKDGRLSAFEGNELGSAGKVAMRVTPTAAGQIGKGNTFSKDSQIRVSPGKVSESAKWRALDAPYLVLGKIAVQGKDGTRAALEIEGGARLEFDGDSGFTVGYSGKGRLKTSGSADKAVLFTSAEKKEPGAWNGIQVYKAGELDLTGAHFEYGASKEKQGVIFVDRGQLELSSSTFKNNAVAVVVRGKEANIKKFTGNTFTDNPIAIRLLVDQLSGLAADNRYSEGSRILIDGGKTQHDGTWVPQEGAQVEFSKDVSIEDATITIAEGATYHVADGVRIKVGYLKNARLVAKGTASAPITFQGLRDEIGTWKSITFYGNAHGNLLEHLILKNAGDKAGLVFKDKSDGEINNFTCEKCEGEALELHKKAKVKSSGVKKL